ncbi:MAG: wax ester/triacylglycerol synthase family O-acyltransferase [Actinomycetales bacterium]|nr:wax ester/triacylglycerol synthase family O-acyltransferase [Actinomycetales bacterium]
MTDRLASLDASFLYMEDATTPMHVGSVLVFGPPSEDSAGQLDFDEIVAIVAERLSSSPRYRQVVRHVPGRIAPPVWVDDTRFDLSYHVRRSALPKPGDRRQLGEFVARVQSRLLDRTRPLWEIYVLEGLEDGGFAIITKAHHALVDGVNARDIGELIVEETPKDDRDGPISSPRLWRPRPAPSDFSLVKDALAEGVRRPRYVVDAVRGGLDEVRTAVGKVGAGLGDMGSALMRASANPAPPSPLNRTIGEARRFVMVDTDLDDYRTIRKQLPRGNFAEDVTTHDVILATITGALRIWMLTRGEPVRSGTTVRALVPVTVEDDDDPSDAKARIDVGLVDLPVGEPSAAMRLHQIAFAMRQQVESGRAVGARRLSNVAAFGAPTMHAVASRAGSAFSRRLFNVSITNVPGPQEPRYVGGAQLRAAYPVMPLAKGQALSIGLTSYNGRVCYGLNADRDSMKDLFVIGEAIPDALEELLEAHRATRTADRGKA